MIKKSKRLLGGVLFALMAMVAPQVSAQSSDDVTIITSDKLEFDHKKGFAFFESNVVVTDPEIKITSDELTIHFDAENDPTTIVAKGHVVIYQGDRKAWAGKATYTMQGGTILLEENPRVTAGRDLLTGDQITYFRDSEKLICKPRARLVFYTEKDRKGAGSLLKGP